MKLRRFERIVTWMGVVALGVFALICFVEGLIDAFHLECSCSEFVDDMWLFLLYISLIMTGFCLPTSFIINISRIANRGFEKE